MSSDIERWGPPEDPTAFESLCLDLWRDIWQNDAQKNGRSGQPQAGVDIFGLHKGKWIGLQCKQKDGRLRHSLKIKELEDEVEAARRFKPALSRFVVATTGPRDGKLQERARELTEEHRKNGFFDVEVWCWDDIWSDLYRREGLFNRIAGVYWPRLTSLVVPKRTPDTQHIFISKLPPVNPTLIGRDSELAFLDYAWDHPGTNFVQIIAAGGTGKTALVDKWFRRHLGEAPVFGWSFYSQGTSLDRQPSSDPFFAEFLRWLRTDVESTASVYAKAEAVANRMRSDRVLLLLDGVEPLQHSNGALRDPALKALLRELSTANRGLVICTTRVRLELPDDAPRALSIVLDNLTPEQGAKYLRSLQVHGTDEELEEASREYWNHALALTLLGTYLVDFCAADIRRRADIPDLVVADSHVHRMIATYERTFAGTPELDVLRALGYFDRPAEPEALKLVLPSMLDREYRVALKRLYDARLILTKDPVHPLDCHPLVREHFAAAATCEGHVQLYEHYIKQAPHRPDTFEEMTPLFYAVYHGCQGGRYAEVLDDVYRDRIIRGREFYLTRSLGALGSDLSLIGNFFVLRWAKPDPTLPPADQAWLISRAGFILSAVGRLGDAVVPIRAGAEAEVKSENWHYAAISYGNLSELHLSLGNLSEAIVAARQAVNLADRSGDRKERMASRTALADALHQSGNLAEASRLFTEVQGIEAEVHPDYILPSPGCYRYCDLLLTEGRTEEAIRLASKALPIAEGKRWILSAGLDHLSLGRAHPIGSVESAHHLDQAIEFLRRAGFVDDLPRGLLARGTLKDLEEVFRIATGCGMRLYLADYHLALTRLALAGGNSAEARVHLEEAESMVRATGYHRRDTQIKELRVELAG